MCWCWPCSCNRCLNRTVSSKIKVFKTSFGRSSNSVSNLNGFSATGWIKQKIFQLIFIISTEWNIAKTIPYKPVYQIRNSESLFHINNEIIVMRNDSEGQKIALFWYYNLSGYIRDFRIIYLISWVIILFKIWMCQSVFYSYSFMWIECEHPIQ